MYSTIVLSCCKFESVVIIHVMGIGITYIKACGVAPRKEENLRTVVESILLFFFYGNVMFDLSVLCRHSSYLFLHVCSTWHAKSTVIYILNQFGIIFAERTDIANKCINETKEIENDWLFIYIFHWKDA